MLKALLVIAIALLAPAAHAADECNDFVLDFGDRVKFIYQPKYVALIQDGQVLTYETAIEKINGQLMEAVIIQAKAPSITIPFQMVEIDGKRKLIYNSQIFEPDCD